MASGAACLCLCLCSSSPSPCRPPAAQAEEAFGRQASACDVAPAGGGLAAARHPPRPAAAGKPAAGTHQPAAEQMAAAGLLMLLRVRSGRGLERNAAMPLRIHGDRGAATWCRGGRRAGEAWVTVCVHHVAMTLSPPGKWQQHAHCNCAIFKMADSQRGHFFPGLQTTAVSPFMVAAKPRHVTSGAPKIRYSQCGGDRVRRQGKGFCVWWRNETGDPGALAAGGGFRSCPRAA